MKCEKCNKEHDGKFGSGRFCSRSCSKSRIITDEIKRKIGKGVKNSKKFQLWVLLQFVERITKICPICKNEFKVTKWYEKRIYCSKECYLKDNHCKYRKKSPGGYNKNSTIKHRSFYKGFQMDSGSELEFAKLLDKNKIKWIKNTNQFFEYKDKKGIRHKYYPDFYLPKFNWWVEIKGKYYETENDKLKLESVGNIEMIYSDNIKLPIKIGNVV